MNKRLADFNKFIQRDWKLKEEDKDIFYRLYYIDETSGIRSIKAEIIINRGIKEVAAFIEEKNNKLKINKNFEDGYVVRKITPDLSLTYQKFSGKFGFSPRDYYMLLYKQYVCIHLSRKLIIVLFSVLLSTMRITQRKKELYALTFWYQKS